MKLGLEVLSNDLKRMDAWGDCGILCNQASVDQDFRHCVDLLAPKLGARLKSLFGPQHGFVSSVQDNMIETEHDMHPTLNIPIYSLYSETRKPTAQMLEAIDTLIIDLPVTGCRVYTYKSTVKLCLEAAKESGLKVVLLDRPNPLGHTQIEGRVPDKGQLSFVAPGYIPMRHAFSMGELARYVNRNIGADLELVELQELSADAFLSESKRHWVISSPNLPTYDSLVFYPGLVLIEACNLSEGRGTTLPFQLIGAPYIKNAESFTSDLKDLLGPSDAYHLRATEFMPSFSKWQGEICRGFQVHVLNSQKCDSFRFTLGLLKLCVKIPGFKWLDTPYEYEFERRPIDVIIGAESSGHKIETLSLDDSFWKDGISEFIDSSEDALIYPRSRACLLPAQ